MDEDIKGKAENRRVVDRRKTQDPNYTGEERRKGDRRQARTLPAA